MLKTVTEPVTQVTMTSQGRGILDECEGVNSEVLFVEGEIHSNMKPVSPLMHRPFDETENLFPFGRVLFASILHLHEHNMLL